MRGANPLPDRNYAIRVIDVAQREHARGYIEIGKVSKVVPVAATGALPNVG